jgi:excisionase family DNA binding protein
MSEAGSDFYVVKEAARILDVGEHRVRQMLREGELEGERDPILDRWKIPKAAVHALREKRPHHKGHPPAALEGPTGAPTSEAADLLSVVRDLERELGRVEGRLQITEVAESTLRDQLERERERADEERNRANRLEEELREARRPWWRRMFGG